MAILSRRLLYPIYLLLLFPAFLFAQGEEEESVTWVEGRLVLEEITIRGELRTPQAIFMMLKSTPDLSNVLLERSFLEDVVRPIYPGTYADDPVLGAARETTVLPGWIRYGSVVALGGFSGYSYSQGNDEIGFVFAIITGIDLIGNIILELAN